MRIVSDFKDYYDSASGFGVDTSIIYTRMSKYLQNDDISDRSVIDDVLKACSKVTDRDRFANIDKRRGTSVIYVGIAGKIYVGLSFTVNALVNKDVKLFDICPSDIEVPIRTIYGWSASDLTEQQLDQKATFFAQSHEVATPREWFSRNSNSRVVENVEVFTKHNLATFLVVESRYGRTVCVNPRLTDVAFHRVLDSYTAFQEIAMHVSGVLASANVKEPEPITDVQRAITKGFDKQSFRKSPTKKAR